MPRSYLKLAAVVAVSAIAAAACGTVKMGAAAIVGSQRISTASLNAEVASYNSFYQKHSTQVQQLRAVLQQELQQQDPGAQLPASQPAQQVLGWMVTFQVADRMAQRYGITVTSAQQQHALSAIPAADRELYAVAVGLPPDMVSDLGQYEAIQTAVQDRLDGGKPPAAGSTASARLRDRFTASQCRAAKSLGIQINPQFGQLDYNPSVLLGMYPVVPAASTLSRAQSSAPASGPALAPHC